MWAIPKKVMHEAVKVKLMLEWRPQELRDASNMDCVLRKSLAIEKVRLKERP